MHGFAARGLTLACAESLTAGLLAATVADVPGASAVLRGGFVAYATDLKESLAGVRRAVLDAHGPVAEETARELAAGARDRCGADWGVGLTGVAGPDPQDGHPVGEVWCGLAGPDGSSCAEPRATRLRIDPELGRRGIREAAVAAAVAELLAAALPDR
ncbi:CinA family protein [Corynebacterium sp. 335C]